MQKLFLAALLLCAGPAAADFQGIIDMDMELSTGKGKMRFFVGEPGTKIDLSLEIKPLPQPIELALLLKNDDLKHMYMISDRMKSYSQLEISEAAKSAPQGTGEPYSIKVLGSERMLGYSVRKLELTRPGEKVHLWVSKDIGVYPVFQKLQAANPQLAGQAEIFRALEKAGEAGFPLKSVIQRENETYSLRVTKVEKKKLEAGLFSIPKGYERTAGNPGLPGAGGPQPSPEQIEEMKTLLEEALKGQQ